MRMLIGLRVIAGVLTGCASDQGVADADQAQTDLANEAPFGVGASRNPILDATKQG